MNQLKKGDVWTLVKLALSIVKPLAIICCAFGVIALLGYFGDVERLYRPILGGPATNPLTALCFVVIGLSIIFSHDNRFSKRKYMIMLAGLLLVCIRLVDEVAGTSFADFVTPFHNMVHEELNMGKSNAMGINSAIMFFFISISLLFHVQRKLVPAQIIAFLGLAVPVVSYTGYAYGFQQFYGQMSLLTASIGIVLALSVLASTANVAGIKALLSPHVGGKISRIQITLGVAIPFWLGFLFVKTILLSDSADLFGVFVVSIIWFISGLVVTSAYYQEKIDQQRRNAEEELLRRATVDPLTQLSNRRHFFEQGMREFDRLKRAKHTHSECGILMLDIDYFKKINDTAGHAMGDEVLKAVGKMLKESTRSVDVVGRLGGEEFAILLVDTPENGMERVAEKIRMNIEKLMIDGWTDLYGPVTVSIGFSSSLYHQSLDELMQAADKALYRAKNNGRNQIMGAQDEGSFQTFPKKIALSTS